MKQNKWLVISFIGVLIVFALVAITGCSREFHSWRGFKAAFVGIFIALGGVVSIITLLLQILKVSETPRSQIFGILFYFIFIFVGAVTAKSLGHAFYAYCP